MRWFYELSWLWQVLGIAVLVAALCVLCTALIGKAAKAAVSGRILVFAGGLGFAAAIVALILFARTPMPL